MSDEEVQVVQSGTDLPASPESDGKKIRSVEQLGRQLQRLVTRSVQEGVGPIDGSVAYANARLAKVLGRPTESVDLRSEATSEQIERAIRRIISESTAAAGVAGFTTGLGGFTTALVLLPANIAGALIINARLAGSIAYLRGYELTDPHVMTVVSMVAAGGQMKNVLQAAGIRVGQQAAKKAVAAIPATALRAINKRIGVNLVAKYGTKRSAVTLAKVVPVAGGLVGGAVDAGFTAAVGRTSKKSFPRDI